MQGQEDAEQPNLLQQTPILKLWHRLNRSFNAPKGAIYIKLQTAAAYASPKNAVLTRLFINLLADYLNEVRLCTV